MISFALPWVAATGLLLGLVPLVLHFLVRRPPARAELPTARFLTPDPRTRVAMDRRPRDLLLLLLRISFLLLLGMGLAGPRFLPEREGTATWVVLDGGPGMAPVWDEALSAARRVLAGLEGESTLLVAGGEGVEEIPVAALLEGDVVPPPGTAGEEGYLGQFQGLRRHLEGESRLDSLEVVLVTRPRGEAWNPGLGGVRNLLYPGAVRLEPVGDEAVGGAGMQESPVERGSLVVRTGEGEGYVEAALEALGRTVEVAPQVGGAEGGGGGRLVVVPGTGLFPGALDAASRGDTVVVEARGGLAVDAPGIWDPAGGLLPASGSSSLLAGEVRVPGAVLHPGAPVPGARIPLTGADGRPAAAALPVGQGCLVVAGFAVEGGGLPLHPAYPRLLEELSGACRPAAAGSAGLDRGALEILQGVGLPPRVGLEGLSPQAGIDLGRWFLLAALLLAILETFLGYRKP